MAANETDLLPYRDTPEDIAQHYRVSSRTIRRLAEKGGLPHRKVGGSLRFNLGEVDAWFAQNGQPVDDDEQGSTEEDSEK